MATEPPGRVSRFVEKIGRKGRRARSLLALASRVDLELRRIENRIDVMSARADAVAAHFDVSDELCREFEAARRSSSYKDAYERAEPLVSVCIATYNRSGLLLERALPSVLKQDYRNLQIIVVGDGCTDDTERRIAEVRDSRVHFSNLPQRGHYPEKHEWRWMVAGTQAMNAALSQVEGDFVAHLDDDDECLPERISTLLGRAKQSRADLVWHPFWWEPRIGVWRLNAAEHFRLQSVTTGSVLYHRWFSRIPWDVNAYRLAEPGDWNRLRKFAYVGADTIREPTPLLRHYREQAQKQA